MFQARPAAEPGGGRFDETGAQIEGPLKAVVADGLNAGERVVLVLVALMFGAPLKS